MLSQKKSFLLSLLLVLAFTGIAEAETRLANIFGDHMVLQQGKPVNIWGWAEPGSKVTVTLTESRDEAVKAVGEEAILRELAEEVATPKDEEPGPVVRVTYEQENVPPFETVTKKATADGEGRWSVTLDPMQASFTPKFLCIAGDAKSAIIDVLVGEVWVTAGQSNMFWSGDKTAWLDKEGLMMPGVRYAHTGRQNSYLPVKDLAERVTWNPCTGKEVKGFPTIPYLFGKYLHRKLQVPVAVVNGASGGAYGNAWCSRDQLKQVEFENVQTMLRMEDAAVARWNDPAGRKEILAEYENKFASQMAEWEQEKKEAEAKNKRPPKQPEHKPPTGPKRPFLLSSLYNARIHPIGPMAIRGALYLQGEQQVLTWAVTRYRYIFPRVITSFREAFGDEELPFGIIALQGSGHNKNRATELESENRTAVVREIHYKAHLNTPNTGFICSHDVGRGLHPNWKRPVAERAVHWALRSVYKTIPDQSWSVDKIEFEDGRAFVYIVENYIRRIRQGREFVYEPAKRPVKIQTWSGNDAQYLDGFLIAGKDKRWYPAKVEPNEETRALEVWSDLVDEPIALRYGWGGFIVANIGPWENPLPPFRTDDWPTSESTNLDEEIKQKDRAEWQATLNERYADMQDRIIRQGQFDAAHGEMLIHGNATGILKSKAERLGAILDEMSADFYADENLKKLDYTEWTNRRYNERRLEDAKDVPQQMDEALKNKKLQEKIENLRKAIEEYRQAAEQIDK